MKSWLAVFAQAQSRWQAAGWLLAAAFPVLALVVDKAASTTYAIFFLAGLWLLLRGRAVRADDAKGILLAFAAYFAVGVLSYFLGEQTRLGEQLLGRDIRFLGALAVFVVLARLALPERLLAAGFIAGGFVTGAVAVAEVLMAGPTHRAGGETISIVFGHLSALLFAVNLAIALFRRTARALPALAAAFALVAITLSSTRGALLAAFAVLAAGILLAVMLEREWRRPRRLAMIAAAVAAAVLVAGWALLPRFQDGWTELQAYKRLADEAGTRAERECLDFATLTRQLKFSRARNLDAAVVADASLAVPGCAPDVAIRLVNRSDRPGTWIGPYRNLPVGADGALRLQGRTAIRLERGGEWQEIEARAPRTIALPPVANVERTRFMLRVAPGEEVLLVPMPLHAGEYAFAAADTPVGSRLAMWAAALRRVDGSLAGTGAGSWPVIMTEEAAAGRVPWRLSAYDHAHSDYLTVLVERGWLGLLALVAVLAAPFAAGFRAARAGGWRGPALLLLVTSVAVSALTETVFNHSSGITYYCALVLLLLTARENEPVS